MRGFGKIICSLLLVEGVLGAGTVASLLNNLLAGQSSTPASAAQPVVPAAPPAAAPSAPVPPAAPPAAAAAAPPAPAPAAAPQAPSAPAAPAPPCPYSKQQPAPAAAAPAPASAATAAPQPQQKVYSDLEITQMNNQLTNLRTSIELFQDYQKPIHMALSYPVMPQDRDAVIQSIMNMYLPILEVANAPQGSAPAPAAKGAAPRVLNSVELMNLNGQLINLRLMVELFQDFQRKYALPNSNAIMQKAYALWDPILKASGSIPKTPFLQPV